MKSTCWDTRTLDSIIKNGQKDTEASVKELLRNEACKAPSQHILIWCTVRYGLKIISAVFRVFQNDCFHNARSIQRYYSRTGIFQMDYSVTYKLAFSPD